VDLNYKANVSQNTGENWEEVKLTLSTGNPAVGGVCPEMNPWYIDLERPPAPAQFNRPRMAEPMAMKMAYADMEINAVMEDAKLEMAAPKPSVTVTESVTSVEYSVAAPYTIASGDGGQDVEITVHSLPAEYRYYSARKLEREVFLLAAVTDWEHLNLIAGEASVFFENRYVGKTFIDPRRAGDKLDLSLGADQSVTVTRVRGKDFTAKTLTGDIRQTRQWELTARNLKTAPIEIELVDQVPVSVSKQVTVDASEISGAAMDKETGVLTWKFTLQPAESKSVTVKYTVTNPKNTTVYLD